METISGILDNKGTPLEKQKFTWKEMAGKPISKLDDDAFTRVRIILMNGVETDALRLKHGIARFNKELRLPLAEIRRVEQHQATMVNWLIGPPLAAGNHGGLRAGGHRGDRRRGAERA